MNSKYKIEHKNVNYDLLHTYMHRPRIQNEKVSVLANLEILQEMSEVVDYTYT